ncbi:MAG: hypothetical protein AAFS11_07785 [Planctomycetota bacterium]
MSPSTVDLAQQASSAAYSFRAQLDQNGDGIFGAGVTGAVADFNAWVINYNAGCQF